MKPEEEFTDEEFMSAAEKRLVLNSLEDISQT